MTVRLLPLVVTPTANFGGWNQTFTNAGIVATGKNIVGPPADTTLRRYAGIRFGGTSVQCMETALKSTPTTWASAGNLPAAASGMLCIWALPGVSPDTLLCGTNNAADGRLYKFLAGTGYTNLNFPDTLNSDAITAVGPTENDADLFLVGNQCRNVAGSPQLWTFRLSTVTWTKIGGTGLNGSWNYTNNNGSIGNTVARNGFIWTTPGNGTVNGFQVWRTADVGASWTKIAGDSVNSSWSATNKRNGSVVLAANGKMYAGIGGTAGNAEVWECTNPGGASPVWVRIGSSTQWTSGTITNASRIATYGNKVVIGTSGSVALDCQVWQYDTTAGTWLRLGVGNFTRFLTGGVYVSPYDQKLFVGTGDNSIGTAFLFEVVAAAGGTFRQGSIYPYPVKVRVS